MWRLEYGDLSSAISRKYYPFFLRYFLHFEMVTSASFSRLSLYNNFTNLHKNPSSVLSPYFNFLPVDLFPWSNRILITTEAPSIPVPTSTSCKQGLLRGQTCPFTARTWRKGTNSWQREGSGCRRNFNFISQQRKACMRHTFWRKRD